MRKVSLSNYKGVGDLSEFFKVTNDVTKERR